MSFVRFSELRNSRLYLELAELLVGLASGGGDLQDVESNSLGDRSALTNGDNIADLDTEGWGNVSWDVLVSLLVSVVLWNVVQVVSSDDDSTVHLGGDDNTRQDLTTDGDVTGEWALLVDVRTLDGGLWGLEAQTNVLIPSLGTSVGLGLWVGEDVWLLHAVVSKLCLCAERAARRVRRSADVGLPSCWHRRTSLAVFPPGSRSPCTALADNLTGLHYGQSDPPGHSCGSRASTRIISLISLARALVYAESPPARIFIPFGKLSQLAQSIQSTS